MFRKILSWFRAPTDPAGNLYYARLRTHNTTFYKLGYTTKPTLRERMAYGHHGDENLVEKELLFCFRSNAYEVEQHLLHHFRKHRAFKKYSNDPTMPLPGRGQTELFRHDVLGLDDELYKAVRTELSAEEVKVLDDQGLGCFVMFIGLVLAPFTLGLSLLFIFMGGSAFFGSAAGHGASNSSALRDGARPAHPPELERLIEALKRDCSLRNAAARPNSVAQST